MIQSERRKYQENDMRPLLQTLAAILAIGAELAPALAAPVCLDTYRIQNTTIPGARTVAIGDEECPPAQAALRVVA